MKDTLLINEPRFRSAIYATEQVVFGGAIASVIGTVATQFFTEQMKPELITGMPTVPAWLLVPLFAGHFIWNSVRLTQFSQAIDEYKGIIKNSSMITAVDNALTYGAPVLTGVLAGWMKALQNVGTPNTVAQVGFWTSMLLGLGAGAYSATIHNAGQIDNDYNT